MQFSENLFVKYRGKTLGAEVVDTKLLNPGDRFAFTKRDSNPILKVKVRIPEMKVYVYPQIELTDEEVVDRRLSELIVTCLNRGDTEPYSAS